MEMCMIHSTSKPEKQSLFIRLCRQKKASKTQGYLPEAGYDASGSASTLLGSNRTSTPIVLAHHLPSVAYKCLFQFLENRLEGIAVPSNNP